jgi:N-acetylneuraminic acid mutarotase
MWYYSIARNEWKKLVDFPPGGRTSAYGFSNNGKIYVGGGFNYDEHNLFRSFGDLFEYDPAF